MYTLILFLPLYSFISLAAFGKWIGHKGSTIISCSFLLLSLILSCFLYYEIVYCKTVVFCKFDLAWISINLLHMRWGLLFDSLSVSMIFIIVLISTLVHIYSTSYMEEDPSLGVFLSFLSLFTFFMLILVTADNFLQMFIGWEGVGFVSFLLISFWNTRLQAVKSSMKAVIMNRVGDLALLISFLVLYVYTGVLEYNLIFMFVDILKSTNITFCYSVFNVLDLVLFLITIGCVAKSAQITLHTWLPDAMEGPTPVSALLHAATMVTAGIYLTLRVSPLLIHSPYVSIIITILGALTAIMAASIAIFQDDIKKIIAYSTCSQLGYMYFSCGLWNFEVAFFHLINHAFFKALLFLSAGSIIHSLNDEQDLKKMGGLVNLLPFSYSVLLVASLAIMGFPYLTGFYSKDTLLELILVSTNIDLSLYCIFIGLITAVFTNIYSIRILYLTFFSVPKTNRTLINFVHDSPYPMLTAQLILALFSIFVGYLLSDLFLGLGSDFWNNSVHLTTASSLIIEAEFMPIILKQLPFILFICTFIIISFSVKFYKTYLLDTFRKTYIIHLQSNGLKAIIFHFKYRWYLYRFLNKRWFFDIYYNFISLKLLKTGYNMLFKIFERGVLEYAGPLGLVYLTAYVNDNFIIKFNSGLIYHYGYIFLTSIVIITFLIIL